MTDISYKGANCIIFGGKSSNLVVDPIVPGQKNLKIYEKTSVQLLTQPQFGLPESDGRRTFSLPGEYEIGEFSVTGVDAISQLDPKAHSVMYRIATPDLVAAVIGHVNPDILSDDQLEGLGVIDVLIVPVGGNGYTIDAHGASKLVKRISPKIVIPVHYAGGGIEYEVDQQLIDDFIKEMGIPAVQEQTLKIKQASQLPETLTLIQLERTA